MDKPPRAAFPLRHAIANIFVETGGVPGFDFDSVQGTRHGNIQHVKKLPLRTLPFSQSGMAQRSIPIMQA